MSFVSGFLLGVMAVLGGLAYLVFRALRPDHRGQTARFLRNLAEGMESKGKEGHG